MIYGDNPIKINERIDPLGLTIYTYVPDISAITQSTNLYIYCGNNPINLLGPSGNITIAIGGSANIALFGKLGISGQLVTDLHGNVGFIITPTVGFGSPNASAGGVLSINQCRYNI